MKIMHKLKLLGKPFENAAGHKISSTKWKS